jgi:hypothetical protein
MENFGKFVAILLLMACGVALQLLVTHIILSIAVLYTITFITQFKFVQIFGSLIIISIIRYRYTPSETKTMGEAFLEGASVLITNLLLYLSVWGMSFLVYYIVFN